MLRFLMLLLTALLFVACDGGAPKLNTGAAAPGFSAIRLDGSTVHFPEDFRGKPVIIRFWAEWCRYCESEMKAIEKVYQRRRGQGLQVLAVNAGQDKETVAAFIKKIGVSYPALLDETSAIARLYDVVGLPTTYFVGADGIVKSKVVGEADETVFDKLAGELL
ncbi:MAG: TlpA family protein disulfide reductase [Betaproteobacteria bacterium]|nr:TlpA family protein disulfide reductase [Betaproteobacteria bacterium]